MTGTIGEAEERKLLANLYDVDYFEVPRFKEYLYIYEDWCESIASVKNIWLDNIVENLEQNMTKTIEFDANDQQKYQDCYNDCNNKLQGKIRNINELNQEKIDLEKEQISVEKRIKFLEQFDEKSKEIVKTGLDFNMDLEEGSKDRVYNEIVEYFDQMILQMSESKIFSSEQQTTLEIFVRNVNKLINYKFIGKLHNELDDPIDE